MLKTFGGVDPIITEELANEIFTYRGKLINPPKKGLTTQQDIDEAETVIDKIIKELS